MKREGAKEAKPAKNIIFTDATEEALRASYTRRKAKKPGLIANLNMPLIKNRIRRVANGIPD